MASPPQPYAPRAYSWAVYALAIILLATAYLTGSHHLIAHIYAILAFGVTAGLIDHFPIRLQTNVLISVSAVVYVFAAIAFPWQVCVWTTFAAGLASLPLKVYLGQFTLRRASFSTAQLVVTVALTSLTYESLGGQRSAIFTRGEDFLALAVAGFVYFCANTALVATFVALSQGRSPRQVWLANYPRLAIYFVGMLAGGAVTAVIWTERPLVTPLVAVMGLLFHRALGVPGLAEQARTDSKTGLYNARHFAHVLNEEVDRAARSGHALSMMIADLDLLREVNNRYGHQKGDEVLRVAGEVIHANTRVADVAARFGGEEFTVLLPETSRLEAQAVADRLRQRLAEVSFNANDGTSFAVTVSVGVAGFPQDAKTADELLARADAALYRAKAEGRNRVCLAEPADTLPAHSLGKLAGV
jgi:diguanylate cyclase (GGDEF)-like protein